MIELFDDQAEFVANIREAFRYHDSVLGVASTGFGKSVTSAWIARSAAQKGSTVWFTCHRRNLVYQTSREFWRMGVEHGLVQAGRRQSRLPVQVCSIDTLGRRLDALTPPDLLVVDECHLAAAKTWRRVIDYCRSHGAKVLGNSGSPHRLDGKPLGDLFDTMVEARPMRWLIDHGRLSDYRIYAPKQALDTSGLHTRGGDYVTAEVESLMDQSTITGDAVQHYRKYANGMRAVAYCVSIKHSQHVADTFTQSGIPAAHIDGGTPDRERKRVIRDFADGRIQVLCNVELITTGFDLSAQVDRDVPIEACILLRPTQSLALYLQMVGRALRRKPRPAVILDHAACAFRHGLPDDEREWSLEGREPGRGKKKDEPIMPVSQCKHCFAIFKPQPKCPECGQPTGAGGREIEEREGELVELDQEAIRRERKREQGKARTLEELAALGVRRGMRKPGAWAAITKAARSGRKPTADEFKQASDAAKVARENIEQEAV